MIFQSLVEEELLSVETSINFAICQSKFCTLLAIIVLMSEDSKNKVREEAMRYIHEVSAVLGPDKYDHFVRILNDFTTTKIDTNTVIHGVCDLLKEHPHLAQGFNFFLPEGYKMPLPEVFELYEGKEIPLEHIQGISSSPITEQEPIADSNITETTHPLHESFYSENDLNAVDRDLYSEATKFILTVKERFTYDTDRLSIIYGLIKEFTTDSRSIADIDADMLDLLKADSADLLVSWIQFLPFSYRPHLFLNPLQKASIWTFLKNFPLLPPKRSSRRLTGAPAPEIQLEDIKPKPRKRPPPKAKEIPHAPYGTIMPLTTDDIILRHEEHAILSSAKRVLSTQPGLWSSFLKTLELYTLEVFTDDDVLQLWREIFKDHTYVVDSLQALLSNDREVLQSNAALLAATPGFKEKLSKVTPSYRALPVDYIHPKCSGRGKLEESVLNDTIVSAPAGSESGGLAHGRVMSAMTVLYNTLTKNEDDISELNMMIDLTVALIRKVEVMSRLSEVVSKYVDSPQSYFAETISPIYQYILRREYGSKADEIIDNIYKHPDVTIPIVLNRLKSKHSELMSLKTELSPHWRETIEVSYEQAVNCELDQIKEQDFELCKPLVIHHDLSEKHVELMKSLGEYPDETLNPDPTDSRVIMDSLGFGEFPVTYESVIRHPVVIEKGIAVLAAISAGLQESSTVVTQFILRFLGSSFFGMNVGTEEVADVVKNFEESEFDLNLPPDSLPLKQVWRANAKVFNPHYVVNDDNPHEIPSPGTGDDGEPINLIYCDLTLVELHKNCRDIVSNPELDPLPKNLGVSTFEEFCRQLLSFSLSSSNQRDFDSFLPTFFGPLNFFPLAVLPVVARRVVVQIIIIKTRSTLACQLVDLHSFVSNQLLAEHGDGYLVPSAKPGKPQLSSEIFQSFASEYRHHAMSLIGSDKCLFDVRVGHCPLRITISILGVLFSTPSPRLPGGLIQTTCDESIIKSFNYVEDEVQVERLQSLNIRVGDEFFQKSVPWRTLPHWKSRKRCHPMLSCHVRPFLKRTMFEFTDFPFVFGNLQVRLDTSTRQFVFTPESFDLMICSHGSTRSVGCEDLQEFPLKRGRQSHSKVTWRDILKNLDDMD
ncbi:hypothetical protein GEMRC1_008154 [Eukaryota sp. GEM-RC1]